MSILDSLFGSGEENNNQAGFDEYSRQMREQAGNYQPWINAGQQGLGRSMGEYEKLINNPNFLQDQITSGFYESPYQKLMQDLVTKRMNFNAANTGMLGSGAANRALQNELLGMSGQFLNDYIGRGMGSYSEGLGGMRNAAQLGYGALNDQSSLINEAAGGQLQGEISKQDAKARSSGNLLGGIGGLLGLAGNLLPGIGGSLSSGVGSILSGIGGNSKASTFDLGGGY